MASNGVTHTPVLIVGGGPVGLALAADLGWRGTECIVVEQGDGTIAHPRANAENARTMEFFRRWGIADAVREAGTPEDFPHTVLYLTSLTGFEIARIERPDHGGRAPTLISPERPQRCNQIWLDPILRNLATSFDGVTLQLRCRLESFVQHDDHVVATVHDLTTGERRQIIADYLIACCGGHSRSAARSASSSRAIRRSNTISTSSFAPRSCGRITTRARRRCTSSPMRKASGAPWSSSTAARCGGSAFAARTITTTPTPSMPPP